jgi:hypothetical protein
VIKDTSSIADPGFFIPDPIFFPFRISDKGSKRFPDPGSASAYKNLSILTQKVVSKLSEIKNVLP